jgi:hypothetical protein
VGDLTWWPLSRFAITNGRHHVAKLLVHTEPGYLLWLDGRLVHRCFKTSTAAVQYAGRHQAPIEQVEAPCSSAEAASAGDANDGAHGGEALPDTG